MPGVLSWVWVEAIERATRKSKSVAQTMNEEDRFFIANLIRSQSREVPSQLCQTAARKLRKLRGNIKTIGLTIHPLSRAHLWMHSIR